MTRWEQQAYRLGQYVVLDKLRYWLNEQEDLNLAKPRIYEWADSFKVSDRQEIIMEN